MQKIETNVVKPETKFFENESEHVILTAEVEKSLDEKINNVETFMKNTVGKGKSEDEKNKIYAESQQIWKEYQSCLRDAKYNFHLNRTQWNFLTNLILQKIEYDVNTVFFAIELTDMLGNMKKVKYTDDKTLIAFPVNATEITYIYHLIQKHKIKGLTKDAYTFAQILRRIGNISKIINYYDTTAKNLATEIQDWVATFEDGVVSEDVINKDTGEVKVLSPKKEKTK
jgi:hypothetical protein